MSPREWPHLSQPEKLWQRAQTGWLRHHHSFLTILEAGSLRSWASRVGLCLSSRLTGSHLLPGSWHAHVETEISDVSSSSSKNTSPLRLGPHPYLFKGPKAVMLEVRTSTYEYWRHNSVNNKLLDNYPLKISEWVSLSSRCSWWRHFRQFHPTPTKRSTNPWHKIEL
jgi:hypothetical protein